MSKGLRLAAQAKLKFRLRVGRRQDKKEQPGSRVQWAKGGLSPPFAFHGFALFQRPFMVKKDAEIILHHVILKNQRQTMAVG